MRRGNGDMTNRARENFMQWKAERVRGSGFRVRDSSGGIANWKMQIAQCKLKKRVGSGQWAASGRAGDAWRETASGFVRNSSFITNPSPPAPLPLGEGTKNGRGVTLVEMLIVITIIVILTVAAIKVVQPTGERRVREAVRAVNVYISSAQHRAIEIGRPCGVIFHRANGTNFPTASTVLDQCEVPPPFSGDQINAVVKVQNWTFRTDYWTDANGYQHPWPYWDNDTTNPPPVLKTIVLKVQVHAGDFPNLLLKYGDLMQLNGQGPYYVIIQDPGNPTDPNCHRTRLPDSTMDPPNNPVIYDFPVDATNDNYIIFDDSGVKIKDTDGDGFIDTHYLTLALTVLSTPMQTLPWPEYRTNTGIWSQPVSFQVLRQPTKTAASPLRLPEGAVVDLDFSGTDSQSFQNPSASYYDVAVMFSSNGAVEGYYWNNTVNPAAGPIYILVGSRSRVRDFVKDKLLATPNLKDLPNWADLSSLWITINYQTGLVSTDENCAINFATQKDSGGNPIDWTTAPNWNWTNPSLYWPFFITQSRKYARESQSMGGR